MPDIKKLLEAVKKQKYIFIILIVGIVLLILPDGNSKKEERSVTEKLEFSVEENEKKIERALSECEGVGRVYVSLAVKGGMESIYAEDEKMSRKDNEGNSSYDIDTKPSLISGGSGKNNALVIKQLYPEYVGAAVMCDGADSAEIRMVVMQTVNALTGISSEKIVVAKMKK